MSFPIRLSVLLPAIVLAVVTTAQPYKYGCHYFHQKAPKPAALTDAQLKSLNESIARSDTFDILHYEIAIDVTNYTAQEIHAATTISFRPLMIGQSAIRFDLYQLIVDSVTDASGALVHQYDGAILRVELSVVPSLTDTVAITVHYQGNPYRDPTWGGFYFASNYIYNLGIGLTTIPPNFGKVWYPCFDSFVERATYTYHVKSAGTFRAHCQGDFLGEQLLGGDTVIRSFHMPQRIPTHLSAIAVADYQDSSYTHTGAFGPVPVTLTAKPAQLNAMVGKLVDLGAAIDACEYWYGPHAFSRVGYVLTTDGALEIPTNIAYPQFMTGQSAFDNRGLYSHELGHHWWGDVIAPYNHEDMWFKEGPAEYTSHMLEEWLYGEAAFVDIVKDNQLYVLQQAHVQDNGFQALSPMPDPEIYGVHTYQKGASVLHNLRGYLGDALFRQGMTEVQQAHAWSTLDATGFKDALETATGVDMDPFFDDQVFAPGFAVFVVQSMDAQPNGSVWDVDLVIRQRLRATATFHMQVPLDRQRQEYQFVGDGEFTTVNVNCDFEPVFAVINGHSRLNQARMDHEYTLAPGVGGGGILPYVDFRVYNDNIVDSTLVRVEHIWAGPDQDLLGWGVDEVSTTHYWIVDGIWPDSTLLRGRAYLDAQQLTDLDWDLYGATETGALLVYRATPQDPWEVYADVTPSLGAPDNGFGYWTIDVLRRGQYAFAKGNAIAGIEDGRENDYHGLLLFPVPATDQLTVLGSIDDASLITIEVLDVTGRVMISRSAAVAHTFDQSIDIARLPAGTYVLDVRMPDGVCVGSSRFEVAR